MKAVLQTIGVPSDAFSLEDPGYFYFEIILTIGSEGEKGADDFFAVVCSPKWLEDNVGNNVIVGSQMFIMREFNYDRLYEAVKELVSKEAGETWKEIATNLRPIAEWEFQGFKGWTDLEGNLLPPDEQLPGPF